MLDRIWNTCIDFAQALIWQVLKERHLITWDKQKNYTYQWLSKTAVISIANAPEIQVSCTKQSIWCQAISLV